MKIYYGHSVLKKDVTELIRSMSRGNKVSLYNCYHDYFGDPVPDKIKELTVEIGKTIKSFPDNTIPLYINFEKETVTAENTTQNYKEYPYARTKETVEFYYGAPWSQVKVTWKVLPFIHEGVLEINRSYGHIMGDPYPNCVKTLVIESPYFGKISIEEDIPFTFSLKEPKIPSLKIVYFINTLICSDNYLPLLTRQMESLKQCGILEEATLYIEASTENEKKLREELSSLVPQARVATYNQNLHEYPGIKKVWELAHEEKESFILYFHSKGASRANIPGHVDPIEALARQEFIPLWRRWVAILASFPSLDKVGLGASREGFAWFNYFWAKAEYLSTCEEPMITQDRYYYEKWLSKTSRERTYIRFFNTKEEYPFLHILNCTRTNSNIGRCLTNLVD